MFHAGPAPLHLCTSQLKGSCKAGPARQEIAEILLERYSGGGFRQARVWELESAPRLRSDSRSNALSNSLNTLCSSVSTHDRTILGS